MTINILGTDYTITEAHNSADPRMVGCDGCCDDSVKEILVESFDGEEGKDNVKADLTAYKRKILRHEIVHAFLFESGLAGNSDWAQNEEVVDWFAIHGPKIIKAWESAGALKEG